jgi:hypothetical protein
LIELRFHHELYDGFAIDEATKLYAPFAELELVKDEISFMVRVTALPQTIADGTDEKTLAAELANYALGRSIDRVGQEGGRP